jgi:hypothetical protein
MEGGVTGVFDFVFVGNFNSRLGAWTDFRVDSKAMSFIAIFLQSLITGCLVRLVGARGVQALYVMFTLPNCIQRVKIG